jgi:hypothetical protein
MIRRDERIGLAPRERRCVEARFLDRMHPELRDELVMLARHRGADAPAPRTASSQSCSSSASPVSGASESSGG